MSSEILINLEKTDDTGVFSPEIAKQDQCFERSKDDRENINLVEIANDSSSNDTGVFTPISRKENRGNDEVLKTASDDSGASTGETDVTISRVENEVTRKKRFTVTADFPESEDSLRYSDVFKPTSQENNTKKISNFVSTAFPRESENEDSLQFSDIFESRSKCKKRKHRFVIPKSPLGSQNSLGCSDIFNSILQSEKKIQIKRKPNSFDQNEHYDAGAGVMISRDENKIIQKKLLTVLADASESENDSRYSDVFKTTSCENTKRISKFFPQEAGSDDSLQFSDLLKSASKYGKPKHRFVIPKSPLGSQNSLGCSDIFNSISQSEKEIQIKRKLNSFDQNKHYDAETGVMISRDENEIIRKKPFTVLADASESEDSSCYSDVFKATSYENNTQKISNFVSLTSPLETKSEDDLQFSGIFESSSNCKKRKHDFAILKRPSESQNSMGYSDIFKSVSQSGTEIKTKPDLIDQNEQTSEKSNSTFSISVRSLCVDTIHSSTNDPSLLSNMEMANKPLNLTYDVSSSAFHQRKHISSLVNIILSDLNQQENRTSDSESIDSSRNMPVHSPSLLSVVEASNKSTTEKSPVSGLASHEESLFSEHTFIPDNSTLLSSAKEKFNKSATYESLISGTTYPEECSISQHTLIPDNSRLLSSTMEKSNEFTAYKSPISDTAPPEECFISEHTLIPDNSLILSSTTEKFDEFTTHKSTISDPESSKESAFPDHTNILISPLLSPAKKKSNESTPHKSPIKCSESVKKSIFSDHNYVPIKLSSTMEKTNESRTHKSAIRDPESSKKFIIPDHSNIAVNSPLLSSSVGKSNDPSIHRSPIHDPKSPEEYFSQDCTNIPVNSASLSSAMEKSNESATHKTPISGVKSSKESCFTDYTNTPVNSPLISSVVEESRKSTTHKTSINDSASPKESVLTDRTNIPVNSAFLSSAMEKSNESTTQKTPVSGAESSKESFFSDHITQVSVFSKSKIGRRSSAPKEFKVPRIPKVVPKKKKGNDFSFKRLPSRPNFPKFDFYCNKRFYDYLTCKLEPKYGIRTNNEAVRLAKYISDVVKEVIAMKSGEHHLLVEEMKKVLFQRGIVTTHYNFYMFCFDYMPPWFRRKAIPMIQPKGCPPNVKFDLMLLFDLIE